MTFMIGSAYFGAGMLVGAGLLVLCVLGLGRYFLDHDELLKEGTLW